LASMLLIWLMNIRNFFVHIENENHNKTRAKTYYARGKIFQLYIVAFY